MIARVLVLTLLVVNLSVAGWLLLGPQPPAEPLLPRNDPGIPPLVLLSERDGLADSTEIGAAGASMAGERCYSLGPIATQAELRRAMTELSEQVLRQQFREQVTLQARGWQVYLPAMPSRDEALSTARRLSEAGVRDYYVVTAGDQQNTISLGLFREQANAQRRQQALVALGFPAEILTRTEPLTQYWIDIAVAPETRVDERLVSGLGTSIALAPVSCF